MQVDPPSPTSPHSSQPTRASPLHSVPPLGSPLTPTSLPLPTPSTQRPGGQDAQHITPASHPISPLSAQLSTRYLLRTDDGVYIQVQTRGWRTGPKEVMQRLSDAAKEGLTGVCPGPEEYKFRLFVEFEVSGVGGGGWRDNVLLRG